MDSKALDYANKGTMNFKHEVKQVELLPTGTFNTGLTAGDVIRINLPSEDYLMNPYASFIEISVDMSNSSALTDDTNFSNRCIQLDSSAHSFIQSLVVTMRDKEVERINNYDVLACFLKDVQYDQATRTKRDYEGNGGTSTPSFHNNIFVRDCLTATNSGNYNPCSGYYPQFNGDFYVDTTTRVYEAGTTLSAINTNANYFTTRNMAQSYSQMAFQPYFNNAGVTYNKASTSTTATKGEYVSNWYDTSRSTDVDTSFYGLTQAYNPTFANVGSEPYFSKTVPLRYLKNGFIKTDFPLTMTFQVPLLSSFFGHLLPPENWKLIPMKYMAGTCLEFTFNPYALFTSWMSTDQTNRNYNIKKISLRTEMIKVLDESWKMRMEEEYRTKGIAIASQAYFCGPSFNVNNGAVPANLYINLGFNSLKNMFFMFLANDYLVNSAFRKQYRLSMAITSMQLQTGVDFYPSQPITGNGGTNYGTVNNNEFIKYFFKCFNRIHGNFGGVINQHNFAINCRELDPTTTTPSFTGNNQLGYFSENRVIGKAVYGIPLDPMNYEGRMWSGLDTTQKTPFQLNLQYDNVITFPRTATMLTWLHHDYMLVVTPQEVITIGRS